MCGGNIEVGENQNIGACESCGSTMTIPNVNDERILNLHYGSGISSRRRMKNFTLPRSRVISPIQHFCFFIACLTGRHFKDRKVIWALLTLLSYGFIRAKIRKTSVKRERRPTFFNRYKDAKSKLLHPMELMCVYLISTDTRLPSSPAVAFISRRIAFAMRP